MGNRPNVPGLGSCEVGQVCCCVSLSYEVYFHSALKINTFAPQMACRNKFDLLGRGKRNYLLCKLLVRQESEPRLSFHPYSNTVKNTLRF